MNPFELSLQRRKEEKQKEEEKKQNKGGDFEFEEIESVGLVHGVWIVFRVLGLPYDMRESSTDVKLVYQSKILADSRKSMIHVNWPQTFNHEGKETGELDQSWILYRFYQEVNAHEWEKLSKEEKDAGKKGTRIYKHKETATFKRIENNKGPKDKYVAGFYPSKRILMNVIDRQDNWCIENKHSKMLTASRNVVEYDDGRRGVFTHTGVPMLVYNKIFDDVVEPRGHWDLDVLVKKDKNEADYSVRDILEDKIPETAKVIGKKGPLTAEERAYTLYNIDSLYPTTSYAKLKKHLIGLFTTWDGEKGTTFAKDLEELVKQEEELRASEKPSTSVAVNKKEEPFEDAEESVQEEKHSEIVTEEITVKEEPKSYRKKKEETKETPKTAGGIRETLETFEFFPNVKSSEQEILVDVIEKFEGSVPTYKAENSKGKKVDLMECDKKDCYFPGSKERTKWPDTVFKCACCGADYS